MKTRSHLLLLALVLVLVVVCFAACNKTDPDPTETTASTTTNAGDTTTAPASTTAATTTAPPPGSIHPHATGIEVVITENVYTGKDITIGYTVKNLRYKVLAVWSFQQIDPETEEPLAGVAPVSKPREVGLYDVTVSFILNPDAATAEDEQYTLPEAQTGGRFEVKRRTIANNELTVSAQGFKTFWYDDMELDLGGGRVAMGTLPNYLERVYTVYKVDDKNGTNPTLLPSAVVTDPGFYKVDITYREPNGIDNVINETDFSHTAIVEIEAIDDEYRVLKVGSRDITIDGVIEPAYYASAKMTSAPDTWSRNNTSGTPSVNYRENIGMVQIHKGAEVENRPDTTMTIYALWGEEEVTVQVDGQPKTETWPFLYVAVEVNDKTILPRSEKYTALRNAWINDSVEFTYYLGGYDIPKLPKTGDTYPTYKTVLADAREKDAGHEHTAVKAQKSYYFDYVVSATKHTDADTYVIEMKIPARKESHVGTVGTSDFKTQGGAALKAGDFVFLCAQLNDLTGLPEGYDTIEAYDATMPGEAKYADDWTDKYATTAWSNFENTLAKYMYCSGNRNADYLRAAGNGPTLFQLSDETYSVEINGTDGVKDADYAKGETGTEDGVVYDYIIVDGVLYVYTTVSDANDIVRYVIGDSEIVFTVDSTGAKNMEEDTDAMASRITVTPASGVASGYAHEIAVDLTGLTRSNLYVETDTSPAS